jgi:hypothetical protein
MNFESAVSRVALGWLGSVFAILLMISMPPVPLHAAPPTRVKVTLPDGLEKAGGRLVLHIETLKLPAHSSGIVRVFADLPEANAETSVEDEHFLGYFAILAKNSAEAARGIERKSVILDLSHKRQFLAGKKETTLTLVPLGGASAATQGAAPSEATFGRVYIAKN